MFDTYCPCTYSLNSFRLQFHGNVNLMKDIKGVVKGCLNKNLSLYNAESQVKDYIMRRFGFDFYVKSGEAIHAIVEEVYNDAERAKHPFYPKEDADLYTVMY